MTIACETDSSFLRSVSEALTSENRAPETTSADVANCLGRSPAERHLLALWSSVRDALVAVESGALDSLSEDPELVALMRTLASDSRRFSDVLEEKIQGRSVPAPRPSVSSVRPKVLVVDDDPCALDAMRMLLEDEYEVCASASASEAARLARAESPDAIVTDLHMPGVDGMGLLDLLETNHFTPAPPLLVVSGEFETASRNRALQRGAFDYLEKPVNVPELMARLHRAVKHGQGMKKAQMLQNTDDLTGLYNRRAFNAALEHTLAQDLSRRQPTTLAMIDQDGLKTINDTYGHAAGDKAIKTVARALRNASRQSDFVVRLGGDEFAVVMPGTGLEGARAMLERVSLELGQTPVELAPGKVKTMRISWGLCNSGGVIADPQTLIDQADAALYEMKRSKGTRTGATLPAPAPVGPAPSHRRDTERLDGLSD